MEWGICINLHFLELAHFLEFSQSERFNLDFAVASGRCRKHGHDEFADFDKDFHCNISSEKSAAEFDFKVALQLDVF